MEAFLDSKEILIYFDEKLFILFSLVSKAVRIWLKVCALHISNEFNLMISFQSRMN